MMTSMDQRPESQLLTREQAAGLAGVSVSTIDRYFPPGDPARHETWPRGQGEGRRAVVRLKRGPVEALKVELGR